MAKNSYELEFLLKLGRNKRSLTSINHPLTLKLSIDHKLFLGQGTLESNQRHSSLRYWYMDHIEELGKLYVGTHLNDNRYSISKIKSQGLDTRW